MRHLHLIRKPTSATVATNVIEYDTGGLNLAACRIPTTDDATGVPSAKSSSYQGGVDVLVNSTHPSGRFPANVVLVQAVADVLDDEIGILKSGKMAQQIKGKQWNTYGTMYDRYAESLGDSGGPSRFFKIV